MTGEPTLAVIIPTSKPLSAVADSLTSLERQADTDVETIVIQNGIAGDEEATQEATRRFDRLGLKVVVESIPGLLAGRHRGVRETDAEVLVFADDDVTFGPQWLTAVRGAFADASVSLVGGPSCPEYEIDSPDWIDEFWSQGDGIRSCSTLSLMEAGDERREIEPQQVWGLNFAIRRQSLLDAGGFHPDGVPWELRRFRGDGETGLCRELAKLGRTAVYEPQALVKHRIPAGRLTIDYFVRRAYLQGVSDSYTAVRENGKPGDSSRATRGSWRSRLASLKNRVPGMRRADGLSEPMRQVRDATIRGYEYHQTEVAADPKLLAWVTRTTYWDYAYPES